DSSQRGTSKEARGSDVLVTAQHTGSLPLFKRGFPPIRGSQRGWRTHTRTHTHTHTHTKTHTHTHTHAHTQTCAHINVQSLPRGLGSWYSLVCVCVCVCVRVCVCECVCE